MVQLLAPSVVLQGKAVNFTTVLRPSSVGTVTYYWWFDNKTEVSLAIKPVERVAAWSVGQLLPPPPLFQPFVTLDGGTSFTFSKEGSHTVTVQASVGNSVLQDQMTVAVYGAILLSFCPDEINGYIFEKEANGSIARRRWCSDPAKCDNYFSASVAPLKSQCRSFASGSGLLLISAKRHPAWTGERSEVCFCVGFRIFPLTCSGVFL